MNIFYHICSLNNLLLAWKEFRRGKNKKKDVQEFQFNLEENLFDIHQSLITKKYQHAPYQSFYIQDPKLRHIHKATVRDRVIHHAVFRILYPIFDRWFVHDSYSCRVEKGTHAAVDRLENFIRRSSFDYTKEVFVLKCDIKKFFDSIDQSLLLSLIKNKINNENFTLLIEKIVFSFQKQPGVGLPLGNVTSQLFANIYLNELDQFIKHKLKVKYYTRYCDDFVIVNENYNYLTELISKISAFLQDRLLLFLHDKKIVIRPHQQGIDFLGHVLLPRYRVLRTKTKRRIFKRLENGLINELSLPSYLGILSHCRGFKLKKQLLY